MKAKIYVGAKKYALYIGRKIVEKTLEFLTLPARFVSRKVQELKNYLIYGNSKQGVLPDDYTQLEYIQNDTNSYIKTGVNDGTDDISYEADFTYVSGSGYQYVLGAYGGDYVKNTVLYINSSNQIGGWVNKQYSGDIMTSDIVIPNQRIKCYADSTKFIVNGITKTDFKEGGTQRAGAELYLFRRNGDGSSYAPQTTSNVIIRLHSLVIKNKGVEVRNYIPVKRNSDNVLGLYDLVSNTFFTNAGTGTFVAGNVTPTPTTPIEIESTGEKQLLPYEYTQLEYIESTGTQYIDLDFGFDNTDEVECKFSIDISEKVDKYIVAPINWNTKANRFGLGVHSTQGTSGISYYTLAYGSQSTGNGVLMPATANDGLLHIWKYSNKICSIIDLGLSKDDSDVTWGTTTANLRLFYGYNAPTKGKVCYYKHTKNNVLKANLIPVKRNSDNVIGMYDLVSNTFLTNAGTGEFMAGGVVGKGGYKVPVVISGKNLFDKVNAPIGGYLQANGVFLNDAGTRHIEFLEIPQGVTRVSRFTKGYVSTDANFLTRIGFYDENKVLIGVLTSFGGGTNTVASIPYNSKYIQCSIGNKDIEGTVIYWGNEQISEYIPYSSTTTNIYLNEPLRKIGDYADYIDFEGQKVVRNIGVKDLKTLTWNYSTSSQRMYATNTGTGSVAPNTPCMCNILKGVGAVVTTASLSSDKSICLGANDTSKNQIYAYDKTYTNASDFTNMITNQDNALFFYPLVTSTEESISLPAIQLEQGTLNLDIDTKIKPSKIEITGVIDNE